MDQERTLQNVKIVVDSFCAELSPLTFQKGGDGFGRKCVPNIIHEVEDDPLQQGSVSDLIPHHHVLQQDGTVNVL